MYEEMITKQELIDAQVDAKTLEDVVNGPSGELIDTRLGRQIYTLASIPVINAVNRDEINGLIAPKANKVDVDAGLELKAPQANTYNKSEVNSLIAPKADQQYVESALSGLTTEASKFYPTLAEANADIANIGVKNPINIGELANGGIWYKATVDAISLTKSPYDPKKQAVVESNNYTNQKTEIVVGVVAQHTTINSILDIEDAIGNRIAYIDQDAILHVEDIKTKGDVSLLKLSPLLRNIDSLSGISLSDDTSVFEIADDIGNIVARITENGDTFLPKLKNPIHGEFQFLKNIGFFNSHLALKSGQYDEVIKSRIADFVRLSQTQDYIIKSTIASSYGASGTTIQRIPTLCQLNSNSALMFFNRGRVGYDGDAYGVDLYKTVVRWDAEYNITIDSPVLFKSVESIEPQGVVKHPHCIRLPDNRLMLIYETNVLVPISNRIYQQWQAFSSDNGQTWSEPTLMSFTNQPSSTAGNTLVLGTSGVIKRLSTGRLITTMYRQDNQIYIIFSDDNGATWTFSNGASSGTPIGEPSFFVDSNENIVIIARENAVSGTKKKFISTDKGQTLTYVSTYEALRGEALGSCQVGVTTTTNNTIIVSTPTDSIDRINLRLLFSFDEGNSFDLVQFQPFENGLYTGYSSIIEINSGVYLLALEGLTVPATINSKESIGVVIVNTNGVLSNVISN